MSGIVRISEAASMGLHTMVLLAANAERVVSTSDVATVLGVSEAHLSKVMQRLGRAGLVESVRGPRGGFSLSRNAGEITLMEVYEAIDGPLGMNTCLLGEAICGERRCILGGLLESLNREVHSYLGRTKLNELTDVFRGTECLGVEK